MTEIKWTLKHLVRSQPVPNITGVFCEGYKTCGPSRKMNTNYHSTIESVLFYYDNALDHLSNIVATKKIDDQLELFNDEHYEHLCTCLAQ